MSDSQPSVAQQGEIDAVNLFNEFLRRFSHLDAIQQAHTVMLIVGQHLRQARPRGDRDPHQHAARLHPGRRLKDAVTNMKVIEALVESAKRAMWVNGPLG